MKKIYLLLVLCCISYSGFAQVTVTPASGGTAICGPTPSCTTLGNITISEGSTTDFASGADQLVLTPPAGWQFCTGTTPILTFAGGEDITAVVSGGFTASSLTVNITSSGTTHFDEVLILNLSVQPLTPSAAPGSITASSVTGIYNIATGVTDFGDLALFPGLITGATSVCSGLTTTLSDASAAGMWSSSNTAVATIDPASGVVSSISGTSGTTQITYSVTGCSTSTVVTVLATPDPITSATTTVCTGFSIALSDDVTGGTWSTAITSAATVGVGSGTVLGITAGTAVITYSTGCGSAVTTTVTVISSPGPISGITTLCAGSFTTLSDNIAGGSWSSSNTAVATINSGSGFLFSGVAGTTTISYTTSCTTVTTTVTVKGSPTAISPAAPSVCPGANITLSDAVTGGTWSSNNTAIATVDPALGIVTGGTTTSTAIITYSTGCGTAVTTSVTVIAGPAPITGPMSLCSGGATITLSDATTGGTWTSSNTSSAVIDPVLGVVTSTLPGTTVISYQSTCTSVTATVNVLTIPGSIIGGGSTGCAGTTISLSDATIGGTWSSDNSSVATVDPALGIVYGVAAGTAVITYSTGCGTGPITGVTILGTPGPITGPMSLCSGGVIITLSDAVTGGSWTSSNTSVATIDPVAGTVTSTLSGTTLITYFTGCGTAATTTVTVLGIPGTITGSTASVCVGSNITLSDATTGGTWSTSNTARATADPVTGIIYGVGAGTVTISYSTGCGTTATVAGTVRPLPGPILGGLTVCPGGLNITLSDAIVGGAWSSSNTMVATIGSATGVVTSGVVTGTSIITYTNVCGSSTATVIVPGTTTAAISPVPASVCVGFTVTLSDATAGGTWSSGATTLATVDPALGIVYGVATGSVVISYATGCGTTVTATVSVLSSPGAITGASALLCAEGSVITLSDPTTGGFWSSGSITIATVGSASGVVTGGSQGIATITYSTGCGTAATTTVTVVGIPGPISPITSDLCSGGSAETLSDAAGGGVWTSATTTVAAVNAATGHVTSGVAGNAVISYTTGCGAPVSATVTVVTGPTAISPATATICSGATITLSDGTTGGTWSSSLSAVATVDPALGVVSGAGTAGTAVISYSIGCGTAATRTVTVIGIPTAITPATTSLCSGATLTLSDAITGGTWSSSTITVATVGSITGVVSGTGTGGTSVITYSTGCGTAATRTVTVNGTPGVISGILTVCSGGSTITLSDAIAGGTWSSGTTTVATIGSATGIVTSGTTGTSTITYSTGCGTPATVTVTVLGVPTAITPATTSLCSGTTLTLSDAITGGTWSSGTTTVATVSPITGVVSGIGTGGTTTITYSTGCAPAVTRVLTVIGIPGTISGTLTVCSGGSTITLSDATVGGTWSSGTSTVAIIGSSSGIVTSGVVGTSTITYSTGCAPAATATVTVLGVPAAISPATGSICSGATVTFSDATTGGTWSSGTSAVATVVAATGIVTGGVTPGTSTITYSTGCGANQTATVTVTGIPGAISGLLKVCASGSTITLSDAIPGGTWSSGTSSVATVGSASGIVTGVVAGITTITYGTSCATSSVTVTVLGTPVALNPTFALCSTSTITLTDATTGGTWSSGTVLVATVGSVTGLVTGGAAGNATIMYSTGCGTAATTTITVIGIPVAISPATANICAAGTVTLSDATTGGTWTSSNTTIATIGSATGFVTGGVTIGPAIISYSTGCGAIVTSTVTVLGVPAAISSATVSVCSGSTVTLSDATTGGTWSSGTTTVATVAPATGVVSGTGTGGISTITYSTGCGASQTATVSVIGIPGAISGLLKVCSGGANITLSDAVPGGTWASTAVTVATIGSTTGIITSGIAGTTTITYATSCGIMGASVTVVGTPVALSPTFTLCSTGTTILTDATTGGTWSSSTTSVATVGSGSGLVTGGAAGNATITYSTGCGTAATTTITVIGIPVAISPTTANICAAGSVTLSDVTSGGTWSSNNTATATVGTGSGLVTGVTTGTAIISYSTGCGAIVTSTVTILGTPDPISGSPSVCSGSTTNLSDDITGGAWSSSNTTIATVGSGTGVVTGGTGGTATITYSTGCGTAATTTVTVTAIPAPISGTLSVCFGGSATTTLSNANAGGTWSSNNTTVATVGSASGIVTGGVAGSATISYATGCGIASATVTVSSSPSAITGSSFVCSGSAVTLSDGSAGGAWSSNNTAVATVDPSLGTVTGGTAGTATITYFTGCGAGAVLSFTVNPLPAVPSAISGSAVVCSGSSITLSDTIAGGVWSSGNTALGTISTMGTLSGITTGTVTVTYTVSNSCGNNSVSSAIVIDAPISTPSPIIGATTVCEGTIIALSDSTAGGVWSSSNTAITVNTSGVCYGAAGGSSVISYTVNNACSNASSISSITVMSLPSPDPITGYTDTLCAGSSVVLTDATPGGVWSSDLTTIAVVSSSGVVTAISGTDATIFYSVTNSCGTVAASVIVTVATLPPIAPILGSTNVCAGHTTSLTDATAGGVWSSSTVSIAAVGSAGTVTAYAEGTTTISYTTSYTCGIEHATTTVTVSGPPVVGPITGSSSVCVGYTTALSDSVAGGVWSSYPLVTAIISSGGVVTGIGTGSVVISYTLTNSCGTATATSAINVVEPTTGGCEAAGVSTVSAIPAELKVFPNPNAGTFTLNLQSAANEPVQVIITNQVGDKVKELTTTTNADTQVQLNVAAGVYFISTVTAEGRQSVKVVVDR